MIIVFLYRIVGYFIFNTKRINGCINTPLYGKETKKKPYFDIHFKKAEHNEKEILIETACIIFSIEVELNSQDKEYQKKLWRYCEALNNLFEINKRNEIWQDVVFTDFKETNIYFSFYI